ncbi:MAG TPA: hypothetical protein VFM53_11440 [Anaeromyxobacteraceae bacterium]|nr:hypothetical protein [Anaeromyxobacteraceae bacterium]
MTTRTQQTLHFNVSRHGWKDLFVVSFLAIVLGAFVAQISSTPKHSSSSQPVASAALDSAANG